MPSHRRRPVLLAALSALVLITPAAVAHEADGSTSTDGGIDHAEATHGHDQHGGEHGHLPASHANVKVVGKARINQDTEGRVADVGVHNGYAYLASHHSIEAAQAVMRRVLGVPPSSDSAAKGAAAARVALSD